MQFLFDNPIMWADGYKISHWRQSPPGTSRIFGYWMSRGGRFAEVVPVGMKYYLMQYLSQRITQEHIDEAKSYFDPYFADDTIFNIKGFERIVRDHDGYWPVRIKFVPEGLPIPTHNVLMTIESTDERVDDEFMAWVTTYLETILSLVWYPTTVATLSREIKKIILSFLVKTGTPEAIDYKLVDFGMRGVSSIESGGIGGFAHLVNFKASDTVSALQVARKIYGEWCAANTIPAAEHSTITIWPTEFDAFKNMVQQFGESAVGMYAVVSDSYDLFHAVKELWGKQLKQKVLEAGNLLVVRPDSGIPHEVVRQTVEDLALNFGYTTNAKGYKVLNGVRVIQGDGITLEEIQRILETLEVRGWSADNITFGMGGALLQRMDRDTQKFAIKASNATVNGRVIDFAKSPITDNNKRSKKGKLKLIQTDDGRFSTVPYSEIGHDILELVYENGKILSTTTLEQIRQRAQVVPDSEVAFL